MAQNLTYENKIQSTVDFSTIATGEFFIYNNEPCMKLDHNNPNYTEIKTGTVGKLTNTDQVCKPLTVLLKLE